VPFNPIIGVGTHERKKNDKWNVDERCVCDCGIHICFPPRSNRPLSMLDKNTTPSTPAMGKQKRCGKRILIGMTEGVGAPTLERSGGDYHLPPP
jgi:hypothetical protein